VVRESPTVRTCSVDRASDPSRALGPSRSTIPGPKAYDIIDLGTLGGGFAIANAISPSGRIVGTSLGMEDFRAVMWVPK